MGKIYQPLNVTEAITLMNDMIRDTPCKDTLIDFQESRKLGSASFEYGSVTTVWWYGFKQRNCHRLVTKRGEKFSSNRADWTKMKNVR
mmetsp:Transcript_20265/g.42388  ORF Transcript_20265/g.42388 Transcript_20265/m.42388 type:complete len:88 (-) Transcript_20265:1449-1712(-)